MLWRTLAHTVAISADIPALVAVRLAVALLLAVASVALLPVGAETLLLSAQEEAV